MSGWRQVSDHVRGKFQIAIDEPNRLGLVWTFPNAEGPQRQYIEPIAAFGLPHVLITANVATTQVMRAYDALLHNTQLAIGALCIQDGFYILRVVLPIDDMDLAVIDRSLEFVAHEAARLRTKATPKAAPAPYYE
jgi:hypothetical protein